MKSSSNGYPTNIKFNPTEMCLAIATSDKLIKYFELSDY